MPFEDGPAAVGTGARVARVRLGLLLLGTFLAGGAGLVAEVAWVRWLARAFGGTTAAIGTTLAIYMVGLAAGSLVLGRVGDAVRRPARLLGGLLLVLGVGIALVPAGIGLVDRIGRALGAGTGPAGRLVQAGLVLPILGGPTVLLGAVVPLAGRVAVARRSGEGRPVRWLGAIYAADTAGAVGGVLLAGLVLVARVGLSSTNGVAAALAVLGGLLVLAASLLEKEGTPTGDEAASRPPDPSGESAGGRLLLLLFLSGGAALVHQIVWTRTLSLSLGSTTWAFSVIVATFLLGLSVGGGLGGLAASATARPRRALVVCELGIVLSSLGGMLLAEHLVVGWGPVPTVSSFLSLVARFLGRAGLVVLLPTVLMGAILPLAFRVARVGGDRVGAPVGGILAANTAGAVVGSLLAAFLLLPVLGGRGAWIVAAGANLLAARVLLPRDGWALGRDLVVIGAVLGLLVAPAADPYARRLVFGPSLLLDREDADVLVEVVRSSRSADRDLLTDRRRGEGGDAPSTVRNQAKQGLLPLVLHPEPRRVLQVGLGTGTTFAAVAALPVRRAECIEISRAIIEASGEAFAGPPRDPARAAFRDPRLAIVHDDAVHRLRREEETWDVVTVGLVHPHVEGAGALFTREFYRSVRDRLAPGGIVCQWLLLDQYRTADLRAIVATFREVFPRARAWLGSPQLALGLVGGDPTVEPGSVASRLDGLDPAAPGVFPGAVLEEVPLEADEICADLLLGVDGMARFAEGAPEVVADRPFVEFGSASLSIDPPPGPIAPRNLAALVEGREETCPPEVLPDGAGPEVRRRIEDLWAARTLAIHGLIASRRGPEGADASGLLRRAVERSPGEVLAGPSLASELATGAREALGRRDPVRAEELLERAVELQPLSRRLRLDLIDAYRRRGGERAALREVRRALPLFPGDPGLESLLDRLRLRLEGEGPAGRGPGPPPGSPRPDGRIDERPAGGL